jgi:hypothetical protein
MLIKTEIADISNYKAETTLTTGKKKRKKDEEK